MKTVKDKYVVVGADFAGFSLKEAVVAELKRKGWKVEDLGVKSPEDADLPENMFHRVGIRVATQVSEGIYERALIFCGTGMGIHLAASKCPHVHVAVCESVPSALRCICGNNCNILSMGGLYVAPQMGIEMAEAFLEHDLGDGYEWWENFYEFHKLAYDELEAFDYEEYKKNGFQMKILGNYPLESKFNDRPKDK